MTDFDDSESDQGLARQEAEPSDYLYFFPEENVTRREVESILADGPAERRAWVVSNLLRYAQWDDIWEFVSRDEVRTMFPTLDLPENLRQAWGRMLKVEAEVG